MDFVIRRAVLEDLDGIMDIMEEASASMEKPEWFVADDADYIREHIEGKGFTVVAEETLHGKTAGFFVVKIPDREDNLGLFLDFDEDRLDQVIVMDSAAVGRAYRGNRLQARMLEAAEQLVGAQYRYLMCTVHPDNKYSLQNMQSHGYQVVKTTECYGGLIRHILLKECV